MYAGPATLRLIYAVDFATLATSGGKFTNGAQTLDGKPWNVENTANADTFQITNGSGLIIDPNATNSVIDVSTRTAPLISIKYGNISPTLITLPRPQIFVQASYTHSNLAANFEQARLLHERYGGGGVLQQSAWIDRAYVNGATFESGTLKNNALVLIADTSSTTDDVLGYYVQSGGTTVGLYTGVTSGGALPAPTAMTRRALVSLNAPSNASGVDDFALTLTAMPVNTDNNLTVTWKKLAVYAAY